MVTVLDSSYTYGNRLAREQGMKSVVKDGPDSVLNMFREVASGSVPDSISSLTGGMSSKDADSFIAGYAMGLKELCVVLNLDTDGIGEEQPTADVAAPIEAEVVEELPEEPTATEEPAASDEVSVAESESVVVTEKVDAAPEVDEAVQPYWTWAEVIRYLVAREGSALAVSRKIGVTHPAVMAWTRGSNPQKKQREKIAAAVGRDVSFFGATASANITHFEERISHLESLVARGIEACASGDNTAIDAWVEEASKN